MKKLSAILFLISLLLLLTILATAAAPTGFAVPWRVIGSGGGDSSNASFSVSGTIGQPLTGVSGNGTLTLSSGYWVGTSANPRIYLPIILK